METKTNRYAWLPEWLRVWLEVPLAIAAGFRAMLEKLDRIAMMLIPKPQPGPFVAVLVEAQAVRPDGTRFPTTLGMSGRIESGYLSLESQANYPLEKGCITVFCDLEQVEVHGIFVGMSLGTCAVGTCPIAFFDKCELGMVIRVQAKRRMTF